jgi:hypothetical protein
MTTWDCGMSTTENAGKYQITIDEIVKEMSK